MCLHPQVYAYLRYIQKILKVVGKNHKYFLIIKHNIKRLQIFYFFSNLVFFFNFSKDNKKN